MVWSDKIYYVNYTGLTFLSLMK